MKRFGSVIPVAVVALVGLLAYSGSFDGQFVFDDDTEIVLKRTLRDPGNYLWSLRGYREQPNRVLGSLTFALNYRVGGLDPTGYHVVNLAVHLATALLVLALVRETFRTPHLRRSALAPASTTIGFVAALLFVAHPIQTQAVTYVVQRYASLATCFYVLAVLLYARWRLALDEGRRGLAAYAAVVLAILAAMKTKEIALTLPVAIALYEAAFFEGSWRRRLAWLAPVLATVLIVPWSTFGLHKPLGEVLSEAVEVRVQTTMSRLDYLATQVTVVARYLRLLFLPVGQNLDYDYPVYRSFLEPRVIASGLILIAVAAGAVLGWGGRVARWTGRALDPGWRLASFGIAWFFVALSVESSVIPIVDVIFEHRVYLPSVGFFLAAAVAGGFLALKLAPARWPAATVAAGVLLASVLGVATWRRNEVWDTEISLWTDVVSKSPGKSRAQDNLGLAYAHLGRDAEALPRFSEAVRLDPLNVRARNNVGVALARLGRLEEARAAFNAALGINPRHAESVYNLGRIYLMYEARYEESIPLFLAAIREKADYAEAYASLGAAWNALGRFPETVRVLEGVRDVIAEQPHARFNLGLAHAMTGDMPSAEREILALRSLSPDLAVRLQAYLAGPPRGGPP